MFKNFSMPFMAADGAGGSASGSDGQPSNAPQGNQSNGNQPQAPVFDYEKLASIITGKQTVTEDTILKNYFKQQGLSQEEAQQAIQSFREQKAKNQPDVAGLQNQVTQYQKAASDALVEKDATLAALSLGVDVKTIPYLLKLADLSNVIGQDGKTDSEKVKAALSKVLEDVPQLKPATQEANRGFQVGANSGQSNNEANNEDMLRTIFGVKKN